MIAKGQTNKVPQIQIDFSRYILNGSATISSIASIFIYYKIKKRKRMISIGFIINSIVYFCYLIVNENRYWVSILLRIMNGIFLGFFNTISISYLFHFVLVDYESFYGYLIQTIMFFGIVFISLILSVASWEILAIILGIQCLLISGLIWIVPELPIPPKSMTHDYITQKQHRYNLFVLFLVMLLQQFSGVGTVFNNVPRMLNGIGIEIESTLQSALMNTIGFFGAFIGAFASVKVSEKYMWAISSFGTCLALIIYSITLQINAESWIGTFGTFLFFVFYGWGQGPIPWFLCGKLFPETVRIESGAITISINMILGIIFTFINQTIHDNVGEFGSIIYSAVMDLVAGFLGLFLIPIKNNTNLENFNII